MTSSLTGQSMYTVRCTDMGFDFALKALYHSGCLHDRVVVIQIGDDRCLVNWNDGGPFEA